MQGLTLLIAGAVGLIASAGPVVTDPALSGRGQGIVTQTDAADRMTVGVHIDDRGPFLFMVDTGAERTVISSELAGALALEAIPNGTVHSLSDMQTVAMVNIPRLSVSNAVVENIRAPSLSRENMGAVGILGIDMLQDQRLVLDFRRKRMTVMPAAERDHGQSGDDIVVQARSRFGRLVLADSAADGQKVYVIIDTGAQVSIGNPALKAKLLKSRKYTAGSIQLISVTGGMVNADYARIHKVRIGDVELREMPIAIADAHIFRQLGLGDRPAILLGMDVLRNFDRVSVDFANRRVRFLMRGGVSRDALLQSADEGHAASRS